MDKTYHQHRTLWKPAKNNWHFKGKAAQIYAGRVWRKTDEMAQKLLLCEPMPGKRYSYMYVDQLRDNTGFEKKNLMEKMQNRKEWRSLVQYALASSSM